jgi:hypothetical protein
MGSGNPAQALLAFYAELRAGRTAASNDQAASKW